MFCWERCGWRLPAAVDATHTHTNVQLAASQRATLACTKLPDLHG